MNGKTDVFRIVYNDGKNHNAICFREPEQSLNYEAEQVIMFDDSGASKFASVNDEGVIPHREPSGEEGENLGVTWHFAK